MKFFKLKSDDMKKIAVGFGACVASDLITVEGQQIGYMYREKPDFKQDSGWLFFSGNESDEYMDTADNFAIYDINTIANYDCDIVPYLNSPVGSSFERKLTGGFLEISE